MTARYSGFDDEDPRAAEDARRKIAERLSGEAAAAFATLGRAFTDGLARSTDDLRRLRDAMLESMAPDERARLSRKERRYKRRYARDRR